MLSRKTWEKEHSQCAVCVTDSCEGQSRASGACHPRASVRSGRRQTASVGREGWVTHVKLHMCTEGEEHFEPGAEKSGCDIYSRKELWESGPQPATADLQNLVEPAEPVG